MSPNQVPGSTYVKVICLPDNDTELTRTAPLATPHQSSAGPRTHDSNAHGETTLLVMRKADFKELLALHTELYDALLRLNCRRLRMMFDALEDLNTRPLASRLAKQILLLARSYGIAQGDEIRIGLQLAQEDLAQLLGASRQRVNQELKGFEREGAVRIEPTRLVVLSKEKLLAIASK